MRYIYYAFGITFMAVFIALDMMSRRAGMSWLGFLEVPAALIGGLLLNRAITNRSLFPSNADTQRMLANAFEKMALGIVAVGLFLLSVVFLILGTRSYFDYSETYPQLTFIGVLMLAGAGAYLLWRYLWFVKHGVTSSKTNVA